jgi:signal transduction histidine kinase
LTDEQQDALDRMQASTRHLVTLLDDILDMAKVESGTMALRFERVCLSDVAREAASAVEPACRAKKLALRIDVQNDLYVSGDPVRIRQILLNLLSNASKFTRSGWVWLQVSTHDEMAIVRVQDTGIGITKAHQAHIFDPFWQADQTITRRVSGTGLGLAITRRLVDAFGGTIRVESEEGNGTTFTVTFPRDPGDAAETHSVTVGSPVTA